MDGYSKGMMRNAGVLVVALALALVASFAACQTAHAAEVGALAKGTITTVSNGGDADNMKGYTHVDAVYRYGWQDGREWNQKSVTRRTLDITGDGDADVIKVTGTKKSSSSPYLKKVKIKVNGKTKKTVKASNIVRVAVSVFTLKNNKPFMWVEYITKKGAVTQVMYRYKSGKLKKVFSNADVAKKNTSNQSITHFASSGNNLHVTFTLTTTVTGETRIVYTYNYKSGTLKRSKNTSTQISYATTKYGTFTKDAVTAAGKFNVYTKTNLKTKKYGVKVGKVVQPVAVRLKGNNLLYQVRVAGKTGWIACPKIKKKSASSPTSMFYETYGKVKLGSSVPTYKRNTYYKASDLQKYNDHALFIARNEIWARAVGKGFANAELNSRFKNQGWYQYAKTHARGFTAAERANIDLILSIEQGRQSPFVS